MYLYLSQAPIKVCITGAAGQIGYSLVYMIGSGAVFGADTKVDLHLFDLPMMMTVLEGVKMELHDCALPCINSEEICFCAVSSS